MKRTILALLAVLFLFSSVLRADDKIAFTEFGLSYGSVIDPSYISNNNTGVLDTAVFEAKAGVEILKWADVYAGAGFYLYLDAKNLQQHYTFFPLFGGVRVNIFPEWIIFPSISAEYGASFSNRHIITNPLIGASDDRPWIARYYNLGIGVSWNITDISILSLIIERPAISGNAGGEMHIFKAGLAWKILY
jgi:hypothetical protein